MMQDWGELVQGLISESLKELHGPIKALVKDTVKAAVSKQIQDAVNEGATEAVQEALEEAIGGLRHGLRFSVNVTTGEGAESADVPVLQYTPVYTPYYLAADQPHGEHDRDEDNPPTPGVQQALREKTLAQVKDDAEPQESTDKTFTTNSPGLHPDEPIALSSNSLPSQSVSEEAAVKKTSKAELLAAVAHETSSRANEDATDQPPTTAKTQPVKKPTITSHPFPARSPDDAVVAPELLPIKVQPANTGNTGGFTSFELSFPGLVQNSAPKDKSAAKNRDSTGVDGLATSRWANTPTDPPTQPSALHTTGSLSRSPKSKNGGGFVKHGQRRIKKNKARCANSEEFLAFLERKRD